MRRCAALASLLAIAPLGCSSDGGTTGGSESSTSGGAGPSSESTLAPTSDATTGGDTSTSSPTTSIGDTTSTGEGSESPSDTSSSTGEPPMQACAVSGVDGDCLDLARCADGNVSLLGICDGPPSLQCCLPAIEVCSVDGAPGVCLPTAECPDGLVTTPGACPGDADIQCCTDPALACDPDAAPLPNEGLVEEAWDPTCPLGMIRVDDFCIDRFEGSLVVVDGGGAVVSSHSPYVHPTGNVRAVSLQGAVPQGYIDADTAEAACQAADKRLCTDDEWRRSCGGPRATTFPYGDVLEAGTCNDARDMHPAIEYFGSAGPEIWSQLGNACILQVPEGIEITGGHAGCVTAEGAFDMVGNLHEWTADPAGTFRGGFFVDTAINGPGCDYVTTAHDRSHWDYSTGFRCCAAPTG